MMYPYNQKKEDGKHKDEHRIIIEKQIGRKLERFEFVHHVNGNKKDNNIDNLKIVSPKEHAIEHGQWKHPKEKKCLMCGEWFTPKPTHRERAKTCSRKCSYDILSIKNRKPDGPRSKYREGAYPSEVKYRKRPPRS